MIRSAACRLWGEFVGSYSTPAQGKKAARQGTSGPARCGFAHRGRRRSSVAQGMPYAAPCSCPTQRPPAGALFGPPIWGVGGIRRAAGAGRGRRSRLNSIAADAVVAGEQVLRVVASDRLARGRLLGQRHRIRGPSGSLHRAGPAGLAPPSGRVTRGVAGSRWSYGATGHLVPWLCRTAAEGGHGYGGSAGGDGGETGKKHGGRAYGRRVRSAEGGPRGCGNREHGSGCSEGGEFASWTVALDHGTPERQERSVQQTAHGKRDEADVWRETGVAMLEDSTFAAPTRVAAAPYAGLGLDRATDRRNDPVWVRAMAAHPKVRVWLLWRDQCLVAGTHQSLSCLPGERCMMSTWWGWRSWGSTTGPPTSLSTSPISDWRTRWHAWAGVVSLAVDW